MEAERSTRPGYELIVSSSSGVAVRAPLVKQITTVGSAPAADLRVAALPAHWATIHRVGGAVDVHVLAGGQRLTLVADQVVQIDGYSVGLVTAGETLALDVLAERLAGADGPADALTTIVDGVIAVAGADLGAVILAERGGFTVAVARDASGRTLDDADQLLSDTIVDEVLGSGAAVRADDVAAGPYRDVRSVVRLGLRAVVCLPLRLGGRTLGAIFVGGRARPLVLPERVHADLKVVAALALPFLAQVRRREAPAAGPDDVLGDSAPIEAVRRLIARVGPTDLSVLIGGPSGAGKEVVARALHARSRRAGRPLVAINCAAVSPSLLDAELFGYRKGAFTGAASDRAGLIEAAAGGALFLDEIGDMPLAMQAALLRVLEQREVRRLGDTEARAVDFRLFAATHRDLAAEVAAGRFREDLLYRIQEVRIDVPPLRDRGDDVLLLARLFLRQIEQQLGLPTHALAPTAEAALRAHAWPGNVRELKAAMRRAAILADGSTIAVADLQLPAAPATPGAGPAAVDRDAPLAEARDAFVKAYVTAALARCGGDREAAALALGIGVRSLYRYLE
ncbi:MAG: sigma-54-dependent Fis family transcriptional regulator [Myxococcales bacterium]|nr:sigma-54-dependent Fis family transcriptional regulator [Myxococcales bacterium]